MGKLYVNESGTDLILDTGILVGTVQFQFINYKKPSGVTGSWSADLYDTYSSLAGLVGTYFLKYTLAYGDLDVPGEWKFQAYVGAVDGTWLGETIIETIYDNFE